MEGNPSMKTQSAVRNWILMLLPVIVFSPLNQLCAQDKLAALKDSLAKNMQSLQQYQWVETTIVSVKGEEKSRVQKQCQYGPDGKVQRQEISATPENKGPHGMRGKVVANKKEEMSDYMQRAISLVRQYVPPRAQALQNAKLAGNVNLDNAGANAVTVDFRDYLQSGDQFSIEIDTATKAIQKLNVVSNMDMDTQKDPVTLNTTFGALPDGTSYPADSILLAPAKKIKIEVQNSNYQKRPMEETPGLMQLENANP
jgi:hypothetical protein